MKRKRDIRTVSLWIEEGTIEVAYMVIEGSVIIISTTFINRGVQTHRGAKP